LQIELGDFSFGLFILGEFGKEVRVVVNEPAAESAQGQGSCTVH
jgi:hypothetical protein